MYSVSFVFILFQVYGGTNETFGLYQIFLGYYVYILLYVAVMEVFNHFSPILPPSPLHFPIGIVTYDFRTELQLSQRKRRVTLLKVWLEAIERALFYHYRWLTREVRQYGYVSQDKFLKEPFINILHFIPLDLAWPHDLCIAFVMS